MKIIIDTNVFLSALIKNSSTRKILMKSGWEFYYPEMSFHEVRKYKDFVIKKSKLSEGEYTNLITSLLKYVNLIPDEQIISNLDEAKNIMLNIDPDDVPFVAAKLSIENSFLWSNDTDFDKQTEVQVIKTKKIVEFFESIF
ncbi:MAG: PIN domain-containing protein [Nanobdellota archaeon]